MPFHILPNPKTFAPGSTLYFVGDGADGNHYGNEAVYELEVGAEGTLMQVESSPPTGPALGFYRQTLEMEENRLYQASLLQAPDIWLWSMLFAPVTKSFSFDVEAPLSVDESSRLTLWLQGGSDFAADPDHHIRVFVNGNFIGETSWDGTAPLTAELDILPGILHEGENHLEVENVGDTAASSSMVFLNRFSIDYPRRPVTDTGRFQGSWNESGTAEVTGLTSTALLLRLDSAGPVWLSDAQDGATSLQFGVEAGKEYLAIDPDAVLRVSEVRQPLQSVLKSTRKSADYVMIGPRDLIDAGAPLLQLRRDRGLRTLAVAFERMVSEFGFGEPTPEAIRDFLSYAYHHWKKPPRYILLLGDASFDFKNYLDAPFKSRLPALEMKTTYLSTSTNPALAAVNGDDLLPDLAIGRLPAANVSELEAMVAKILAYENSGQSITDHIVLVADNPDTAGNFDADADERATGMSAVSTSPKSI